MKIKTVIGVLGLVFLIGMDVALALSPPPLPNMENGVAPSSEGVEPGPPRVAGEQGPPAPPVGVERPAPLSSGRGIPTVEEAEIAVSTVREIARFLRPGPVWERQDPAGKIEIKAALVYGERCVAVLTLDPETGRPLPLGWRPLRGLPVAQWRAVKGILPSVVRR